MAITVILDDHTGNISRQARMDEKAEVAQLIPAIVRALNLPITDNAGRPMTYHLSYNGRQLQNNETLATAEVEEGGTLTIVPEMTAGAFSDELTQNGSSSPVVIEPTARITQPIKGFPTEPLIVHVATDAVQVSLDPTALQQVWTQAKAAEHQEIGGILIGKVYEEEERFLVNIEEVLLAEYTKAGMAFVTFTDQTWIEILRQLNNHPKLVVVGWYHSHPGFGIFLSMSDEFIHRSFFGDRPWYLALVVDPIADSWGVFTWDQGQITQCRAC